MNKALRISGIVLIIIVIFAAIIASMTVKPSAEDKVWDMSTTIGNPKAKNYFVVYSDLVCPYCVAFENAIVEHEDEFQKYLEENDVLYEVRVSDFLYEYGEARAISSRYSALGAYCAKNQGKFWDYYNEAISSVWNDYFKAMGKSALSKLNSSGQEYWVEIGKKVGLDNEEFTSCVENEEPLEEIKENAKKSANLITGMPSFKLNSYSPPGFDLSGDWEDVKAYFDEGLKS